MSTWIYIYHWSFLKCFKIITLAFALRECEINREPVVAKFCIVVYTKFLTKFCIVVYTKFLTLTNL